MANNFKDTNIYGNFTVKPLYATYSNIGVASGSVTVPAYFQNTGDCSLNNVKITGSFNCGNVYLKGDSVGNAIINLGSGINNISTVYSNGIQFQTTGSLTFLNGAGTGYPLIVEQHGNVGLGSIPPTELLHLYNGNMYLQGSTSKIYLGSKNNYLYGDATNMAMRTDGDIYIQDLSTNIKKMFIQKDGKIGIGTDTPTEALDVNGNVKCTYLKTSSDYRLKQNVQPLNGEYDISKLKPVSYQMMGKKATGFIAHELQEVFPHLVTGKKDGYEMQSVDYIGMIAILTYNFQNLKKEVDELKSKLNI